MYFLPILNQFIVPCSIPTVVSWPIFPFPIPTVVSWPICTFPRKLVWWSGTLFFFISWRLITLQYCSGFCHTLTRISHGFTCIPHPDPPSHFPLYLIPLGLPSVPALSIYFLTHLKLQNHLTFSRGFLHIKLHMRWLSFSQIRQVFIFSSSTVLPILKQYLVLILKNRAGIPPRHFKVEVLPICLWCWWTALWRRSIKFRINSFADTTSHLLPQRKFIWISSNEMDETGAHYTEWSKPER